MRRNPASAWRRWIARSRRRGWISSASRPAPLTQRCCSTFSSNAADEEDTLRIWEKHGIQQAGFWTTAIGESNNDLTYMIRWDSMGDRETRWGAFLADSEWHAARDKSEADGLIIANVASQFLSPTKFSRPI